MASPVEVGRQLERRIAAFFAEHGYQVALNQVLEGRSGGRHEIDVLATKSDPLTTFRVAVECKAWQQPIEKDVVSKLSYVVSDLGLNKGIIVSLGGCRSGADRAAAELGIDLWGPDELKQRLGEYALGDLAAEAPTSSQQAGWGYPFIITQEQVNAAFEQGTRNGKRFNGRDPVLWSSPIWVPAFAMGLTTTRTVQVRRKRELRTATHASIFDGLEGRFLSQVQAPWAEVQFDQRLALSPGLTPSKIQSQVRAAFRDYERVSSPSAKARHSERLNGLGIATPLQALSVDRCDLVHLPAQIAILGPEQSQRVIAVWGHTGQLSPKLSQLLTRQLSRIRSHFA